MKYGLLAIVSLFGVCVLRADDASAAAGVPERAAAVYSVVDGQKLGIVAFEDDYPVVLSKGARLTQTEPRVMLVPAPGFAAGLVTVDRTEKTTSESVLGNSLLSVDNVKQDVVSFTAKVTADRGLGDVYLLMLAYEDLGGSYAEAPKFAIL